MSKASTRSFLRPLAILAIIGAASACLGALFAKPADNTTALQTDIVWRVPEGPPLSFTPVLGKLSTELSATGLFGYPLDTDPNAGGLPDPSADTNDPRLPALLVLGQKDDQMVAIARMEDGSLQTFSVGDLLESGWTISAITPNGLEIERNGERDEIFLREPIPTGVP